MPKNALMFQIRDLLQALHMVLMKPNDDNRLILTQVSRSIAQSVTDLVAQGEIIKGQTEDLVGQNTSNVPSNIHFSYRPTRPTRL